MIKYTAKEFLKDDQKLRKFYKFITKYIKSDKSILECVSAKIDVLDYNGMFRAYVREFYSREYWNINQLKDYYLCVPKKKVLI